MINATKKSFPAAALLFTAFLGPWAWPDESAEDPPGTIHIQALHFSRGDARETGHGEPLSITGGFAEYDLEIQAPGNYLLVARYAAAEPRSAELHLDGLLVTERAMASNFGGWAPSAGRWEDQCVLPFTAGPHVLKFAAIGPHFTAFKLIPTNREALIPALQERKDALLAEVTRMTAAARPFARTAEGKEVLQGLAGMSRDLTRIDVGVLAETSYRVLDAVRSRLPGLHTPLAGLRTHRLAGRRDRVVVWASNPLVKHRRETLLPLEANTKQVVMECCRNEYEPAQVCLSAYDCQGPVRVRVGPLVHQSGKHRLTEVNARFVGYVPVPNQGLWPDPLLLDEEVTMEPRQTQPVWITVKVPGEARPGDYRGQVEVLTARGQAGLAIRLHVHPMTLPQDPGLWVGVWSAPFLWEQLGIHTLGTSNNSRDQGFEGFDDRYFAFLQEEILRNRYEHRTRVFSDLINWELANLLRASWTDGGYVLDFSLFDRLVSTVERAFGSHFRITCCGFGFLTAPDSDGVVNTDKMRDFFQKMEQHLAEKGWLDHVYFKYVDEPGLHGGAAGVQTALQVTRQVKTWAPRIRLNETVAEYGGPQLEAEHIDLPIVARHTLLPDAPGPRAQMAKGREVWWYNNYTNMIDRSSLHPRIMGWISYLYGFQGYMHWACDWPGTGHLDPWTSTFTPGFGAGEGFLVYPDRSRKKIVDSLRWEMFREMIEDYDTLCLLEKAGGDGKKYGRQLVKDLIEYELDPVRFYRVRHEVLVELARRMAE